MKIRRKLDNCKLQRCLKGGVTIEFALIGTVLFIMLFGIIEVGMITFSQVVVENATNKTVRNIRLGLDGGTGNMKQYIRDEIRRNTVGLINNNNIIITTDLDTNYNVIPKPEKCLADPPAPAGTCPAGAPFQDANGNGKYDGDMPELELGGPGDRIRIAVYYNWNVISPILRPLMGENGSLVIKSTTFVKNEPF